MEMFLMALALSLLGVAVSAMTFGAATGDAGEHPVEPARPSRPAAREAEQGFFVSHGSTAPEPEVPIDALLLAIERHVRLEHAAAEAFHQAPTPESLHIRTASTLVH
jgi:hypothetical protein